MTYASEVLADSPLLYLPFGESSGLTATDASGNGRNGTYVSGPTLGAASLVPSDASTSVDLEASGGNYITVPDDGSLDGLTALTLEAWIRPESISGTPMLAARDGLTANRSFQWRLNGTTGKLEFVRIPGTVVTAATSSALSAGSDYYVAVVYNGTDIRLFVNGALNGTPAACTGSVGTSSEVLRIGARRNSTPTTADYYDGLMGHFAAYNTALSSTRIAAHYAAGLTAPPNEGVFAAQVAGVTSALTGTADSPVAGAFSADVAGVTSALTGTAAGGAVEGVFNASVAGVTSALTGELQFDAFEPARVGAGISLGCSARLSPPLSVDVEETVPFRRVAASVSEG